MSKNLFRTICEVIGQIDREIKVINLENEDLSVADATQILAEIEDKLVDCIYEES